MTGFVTKLELEVVKTLPAVGFAFGRQRIGSEGLHLRKVAVGFGSCRITVGGFVVKPRGTEMETSCQCRKERLVGTTGWPYSCAASFRASPAQSNHLYHLSAFPAELMCASGVGGSL